MPPPERADAVVGSYDTNGDGKIDTVTYDRDKDGIKVIATS